MLEASLRPCVSSQISDYNYNTNTGQIRLCCLCQHELSSHFRAQNPSNSQKQQRAECGTLWVSAAVRTVFITILDSVKSVIIRGQCHRRNGTDIHTGRRRNVCMYCDEFDWHIYVRRRGGRDIMWTLNNVITNYHSGIEMTWWPIRGCDLSPLTNKKQASRQSRWP